MTFLAAGGDDFCVLHCAGLISIASKPDEALYAVNVQGTQNIVDLCREFGASRLIYVSSVHAIPEKPAPETITEPDRFAPDEILGDYGKSKAMATALVLEAAQSGLNASVVLPSGILGPGDLARGNMTRMLLAFCRGRRRSASKAATISLTSGMSRPVFSPARNAERLGNATFFPATTRAFRTCLP